VLRNVSKNLQYQIPWKYLQKFLSCYMWTYGQADKHSKANSWILTTFPNTSPFVLLMCSCSTIGKEHLTSLFCLSVTYIKSVKGKRPFLNYKAEHVVCRITNREQPISAEKHYRLPMIQSIVSGQHVTITSILNWSWLLASMYLHTTPLFLKKKTGTPKLGYFCLQHSCWRYPLTHAIHWGSTVF
jgi:hypothetical protein